MINNQIIFFEKFLNSYFLRIIVQGSNKNKMKRLIFMKRQPIGVDDFKEIAEK